ncbi:hypothetical protein [Mycolicibacterium elephantis]|uniref:Uncharacterized protein n=1 Tax=Mycolicibacterium elephantis DSM 44368 TaxID=1335622 RepID=A0A439DV57_9MYCO|nr:hypothetical protein [Mycolicibacterium elephantis]MCV7220831.1 hypothetical protein [Mycolicibacterium elephantis]RWA20879.1 hypothetical protein MELE44368_02700 [Mycolicibacterium elephantis DSM 44368]
MTDSGLTTAFLDLPVTVRVWQLLLMLVIAAVLGYAIRYAQDKENERGRDDDEPTWH